MFFRGEFKLCLNLNAKFVSGYTNQQVAVQKPTNQEADDDIKLKYPAIPVAIGRFMVIQSFSVLAL